MDKIAESIINLSEASIKNSDNIIVISRNLKWIVRKIFEIQAKQRDLQKQINYLRLNLK